MSFAPGVPSPFQSKGGIPFRRQRLFKFAQQGAADKAAVIEEEPLAFQPQIAQKRVIPFYGVEEDDEDEDDEDDANNEQDKTDEDDADEEDKDDEGEEEGRDDDEEDDEEADEHEPIRPTKGTTVTGIGTPTASDSCHCSVSLQSLANRVAELEKVVAGRGHHLTAADAFNRNLENAVAENARLSKEQTTQLKDLQNTRQTVVRLRRCLREREYSTGKLEEEVRKKEARIRTLREVNGDLREKVATTKDAMKAKEKRIASLGAEKRYLQDELAKMRAKVGVPRQVPELERQVVTLKKALGDADVLTRQVEVKNETLEREAASMKATIEDLVEVEIPSLNGEIERLQEEVALAEAEARKVDMGEWEWDVMRHNVSRAEAQMRALDNVSRFKVQARLESSFVQAKRSLRSALLVEPAAVGEKVQEMNERIRELSSTLVEVVERAAWWGCAGSSESSAEATPTGQWIELSTVLSAILTVDAEAPRRLLLVRVAFEMFFVHWCVDIVEANYPNQPSFADFLIDVCYAQSGAGDSSESDIQPPSVTPATCIPPRNIIPPPIGPTSYATWTKDVMADLASRILVPLGVSPQRRPAAIEQRVSQLLEIAHDLRLGLAEKQHLGGLELGVVGFGVPFRERFMSDAFADRDVTVGGMEGFRDLKNSVLGTTGLGLQRDLAFGQASVGAQRNDGRNFQKVEILVKPKVFVCR